MPKAAQAGCCSFAWMIAGTLPGTGQLVTVPPSPRFDYPAPHFPPGFCGRPPIGNWQEEPVGVTGILV